MAKTATEAPLSCTEADASARRGAAFARRIWFLRPELQKFNFNRPKTLKINPKHHFKHPMDPF